MKLLFLVLYIQGEAVTVRFQIRLTGLIGDFESKRLDSHWRTKVLNAWVFDSFLHVMHLWGRIWRCLIDNLSWCFISTMKFTSHYPKVYLEEISLSFSDKLISASPTLCFWVNVFKQQSKLLHSTTSCLYIYRKWRKDALWNTFNCTSKSWV